MGALILIIAVAFVVAFLVYKFIKSELLLKDDHNFGNVRGHVSPKGEVPKFTPPKPRQSPPPLPSTPSSYTSVNSGTTVSNTNSSSDINTAFNTAVMISTFDDKPSSSCNTTSDWNRSDTSTECSSSTSYNND